MNSHACMERTPRLAKAFGPFYPASLQDAVNHAERLAELLTIDRVAPSIGDEWAAAWIIGRSSEIEQFVALAIDAWKQGDVAESHAAGIIQSYLAALHEGLVKHLGLKKPPCCAASIAASVLRLPAAVDRRPETLATGEVASVDDLLARIGGPGDTERDSGWSLP